MSGAVSDVISEFSTGGKNAKRSVVSLSHAVPGRGSPETTYAFFLPSGPGFMGVSFGIVGFAGSGRIGRQPALHRVFLKV